MREIAGPVELGPQRLSGMFFVPRSLPLTTWVEMSAGSISPGAPLRPIGTIGADPGAPLRDAFLDLIRNANRKVLLASFLFADGEITDALARAAERLRGGVYVLTALSRGFQVDLGESDGPDVERRAAERREQHFANLRTLAAAGVWLRSAPDLHAKLCVADDRRALVTSANVTAEAFERNPENGIILESPELSRELGRIFSRVFLHRAKEESAPAATLDLGRAPATSPPPWNRLRHGNEDRVVATISGDERSIEDALVELLEGAEREVVFTVYSAVGLREHPVGLSLRKAISRPGLKVLGVLPPENRDPDRRETGSWLFQHARAGQIDLRGLPYTHAKVLVVDRARALVWTGNLDGHHGFADGFEVGVLTSRPEVAQALRDYVISLARRASHSVVFGPTLRDLAVAHGGLVEMEGEWLIELPKDASLTAQALADALKQSLVSVIRRSQEIILQVEGIGQIKGKADHDHRRLLVTEVTSRPAVLLRPDGYLGSCRVRVAKEVEQKRGNRSQAPRKRR